MSTMICRDALRSFPGDACVLTVSRLRSDDRMLAARPREVLAATLSAREPEELREHQSATLFEDGGALDFGLSTISPG